MGGRGFLLAWLAVAVVASGCTGDGGSGDSSERAVSSVVVSDSVSLSAADVQRDTGQVVADSVVLESPGYLVVYEDGGGAPGRILAASDLLDAGKSSGVEVDLPGGLDVGSSVWLMLHSEDGASEGFGFGVGDPPLAGDEGVGVLRVELKPDSSRS